MQVEGSESTSSSLPVKTGMVLVYTNMMVQTLEGS
jgi:hypothetical protein